MEYTTLPIIRTKQLSDNYTEIVVKRKREIVYKPGDCLYIKNGTNDEYITGIIASGMQEPWIRLIFASDISPDILQASKLRVKKDKASVFSGLSLDVKSPVFICASVETSVFLSYVSTYPGDHVIVYTIGDVPNQEWIDNYPQAIKCASVQELGEQYILQALPNHYICTPPDIASSVKNILASAGVSQDKIKLIEY